MEPVDLDTAWWKLSIHSYLMIESIHVQSVCGEEREIDEKIEIFFDLAAFAINLFRLDVFGKIEARLWGIKSYISRRVGSSQVSISVCLESNHLINWLWRPILVELRQKILTFVRSFGFFTSLSWMWRML